MAPKNAKKGIRVGKKKVQPAPQKAKPQAARGGLKGPMTSQPRFINENDFIKMTLDPCNGPLTASPFGSTETAYVWRFNYRKVILANPSGNMMAALYPGGVVNAGTATVANMPQCVQLWNHSLLTDTVSPLNSQGGDFFPGTQNFLTLAEQLRVTAGCIKVNYTGPANLAGGELFAWEGQGDGTFTSVNASNLMTMVSSVQQFCINGNTFPITAGVEARLNYAKAAAASQQAYVSPAVNRTDVYCPFAVVGVSGGPASGQYVVESTIIVEWTPALSQGIPSATSMFARPGAAERVANALKMVSPMLVSAGKLALGGYAGAFGKALSFGGQVAASMAK